MQMSVISALLFLLKPNDISPVTVEVLNSNDYIYSVIV